MEFESVTSVIPVLSHSWKLIRGKELDVTSMPFKALNGSAPYYIKNETFGCKGPHDANKLF